MDSNVTLDWKIRSHITTLYLQRIQKYVFYIKALIYIIFNFNSPLTSLKKIKSRTYPYSLHKNNSDTVKIKNKDSLALVLKGIDDAVKFENDLMTINFNNHKLKFKHYESIELDIFTQNLYSKLNVKNKICIRKKIKY